MRFSSIPFLAGVTPSGGGGGSGLTVVQAPTRTAQYFGTQVQQSLTAVGSGNHLVVGIVGWTSGGTPTMSDSAGGSWTGTQVHSYVSTTGSATMYFFIRQNVTSGLTWVRATYGSDVEAYMSVVEVSGSGAVLDGTPQDAAQSAATQWDHAFTSSEDNVLFMGLGALSNSQTSTGISPVTADCPGEWFVNSRGLFPTAGSNTASFTLGDSRSGHKSWIVVKGT